MIKRCVMTLLLFAITGALLCAKDGWDLAGAKMEAWERKPDMEHVKCLNYLDPEDFEDANVPKFLQDRRKYILFSSKGTVYYICIADAYIKTNEAQPKTMRKIWLLHPNKMDKYNVNKNLRKGDYAVFIDQDDAIMYASNEPPHPSGHVREYKTMIKLQREDKNKW